MEKEKLIEKLRKLLALSTSSNQHEAELALAKFNELMTIHQLEMSEIEVKQKGAVGEDKTDYQRKGSKFIWQSRLSNVCAKINSCSIVIHNAGDKYALSWIGKRDDVAQAKMLYEHLTQSWEAIFKNYLKETWTTSTKTVRNSHALGFAVALQHRAEELIRQREQMLRGARTTGTALILLTGQEVAEYMADKYPHLKASRRTRRGIDDAAFGDGHNHGKRIALGGALR